MRHLLAGVIGQLHVQQNTYFCCIRPTSPYLSAPLKPDNLAPICNNNSENMLRGNW